MPIQDHQLLIESFSPHEGHVHGVTGVIATSRSPYQAIEIVELGSYGKALILDGKVQSTTVDEFIYHESIIHPAMLCHPNPRRVFVVGGGEGAPVREILKHRSVESVLMVDIDSEVVEFCRRHLPEMSAGAFEDPRVRVEFMDARAFLESSDQTFDILIIDISEPIEEGPAYLLFTQEFYKVVFDRLTAQGALAVQAGTISLTGLDCFATVHATLRSVFPVVAPYFADIPSFGRPWGFLYAGKGEHPAAVGRDEIDRRIRERVGGPLRYYDGETHAMSFCLPKHVRKQLAAEKRIIEDNHPLFAFR
jgi:spermidine synthase